MSIFGSLFRTAIDIVKLPVAASKDAIAIPGAVGYIDGNNSHTGDQIQNVRRDITESGPRVITYRTIYGGRVRCIVASDMYNAAANRMTKDTGNKWTCSDCKAAAVAPLASYADLVLASGTRNTVFVVRRGKHIRHVRVL